MKTLVVGLQVNCSTTELRYTKSFSSDNQFEVVEELICFRYSLNDKHLHRLGRGMKDGGHAENVLVVSF